MLMFVKKLYRFLYFNLFSPFVKFMFNKLVSFVSIEQQYIFLGSNYGGWAFVDDESIKDSIVISAGAGEDISFDIELINMYNCKIIIIDPTPRALAHFDTVINNLGQEKTTNYRENSGNQDINSYNLKKVAIGNLSYINKALSNKNNIKVNFYKPPNEEWVSHSMSNWQNNFKKNDDYIKVETITLANVINENKLNNISILKLDIEGAENQVIPDMLKNKIFPRQLLVEFDELHGNYIRSYIKASIIILKLRLYGYKRIATESKFGDFLFIKTKN